jgi:ribosomal protein S28E/S33
MAQNLRKQLNHATLPGEIVQVASRMMAPEISKRAIVEFPGRAVVGPVQHNIIVGIAQQIESKRLEKRLALCEKENAPRTSPVSVIPPRLTTVSTRDCKSLKRNERPSGPTGRKDDTIFFRMMIKQCRIAPTGYVEDQSIERFDLGDRHRDALIERTLRMKKVKTILPAVKVGIKTARIPPASVPERRPLGGRSWTEHSMQNCQAQTVQSRCFQRSVPTEFS